MLTKKKTFFYILLFFCNQLTFSLPTSHVPYDDFFLFIQKNVIIQDGRPFHRDETNRVNSTLLEVFEEKYILKHDISENDIDIYLKLFYKSSDSWYEDAPDVYYKTRNRTICFLILSIASNKEKNYTFLEDAQKYIYQNNDFTQLYFSLKLFELLYAIDAGFIKPLISIDNEINKLLNNQEVTELLDRNYLNDFQTIFSLLQECYSLPLDY